MSCSAPPIHCRYPCCRQTGSCFAPWELEPLASFADCENEVGCASSCKQTCGQASNWVPCNHDKYECYCHQISSVLHQYVSSYCQMPCNPWFCGCEHWDGKCTF